MKRVALAALFASLTFATAVPAFADEYDDAVATQIGKYLSYPEMAVNQQVEGRVGVRLQVDGQGHVTDVSLDGRSGYGSLDRATLKAVRRLAPTLVAATGVPHDIHLFVNYKLV
ncbi:MAG: energy transducer TonB [Aliidongia sp.]